MSDNSHAKEFLHTITTKYEDVKNQTTEEYFNRNEFSIDAFNKKYSAHDGESYVQALKRVCDHIASVESTHELREYWSIRWFDEIYNDWWHPAGSIMQGAGTHRKISLANCTTISLGALRDNEEWDNLESIVRNTAYTVAKCAAYRQGLGVDFSSLRPAGTKVLNSANQSTGAVHWMKFIDKIGYSVGQKGRIPAMLFSLKVDHPDIEEFITVKGDYTQIQNANISVQITEKFYKAVAADADWELRFDVPGIKKGEKIYIDIHSIDMESIREKETGRYYKIATHDKKKEVFTKIVKAKKLLELIAKNMQQNAEPGIQNIDIARKYSNSDYVYDPNDEYDSRILSTNAPLIGSTLIPTKYGIKSIKELYEKESEWVLADTISTLPPELIDYKSQPFKAYGRYNFPTKTFPVLAKFKKYKDQEVYKIKLNTGKELFCNSEHKWLVNGRMQKTIDLKKGDKLFKSNGGIVQAFGLEVDTSSKDFKDGQLIGFFVGDGWIGKESSTHNKMIGLIYNNDDQYFADLFKNKFLELTETQLGYERDNITTKSMRSENKKFVQYFESFGFVDHKYFIPKKCYTNLNFCSGFLQGLFQADGHVKFNDRQGSILLTSVSEDIIYECNSLLLNWFGIHSTINYSDKVKGVRYGKNKEKISNAKPVYRLVISVRNHLIRFREHINLQSKKALVLSTVHNNCQQYNNRISEKIISVEKTNRIEDMYCAVVDGLESFIVSGYVSSNCSEQYLSRESLCVLASANVGKFSITPEVYIKQLERISISMNRFLDNVNECELIYQTYATPHQKLAIQKLRRTGAGVTNIAAWFIKKNLVYATKEANFAFEEFIKLFNHFLYVGSEHTGKEKGNFGLFSKEKWKSSPFVKRVMDESIKLHEKYGVPIVTGNYARNVTNSSIAPTGTLSLMFRKMVLSYGIEAAFFLYYWKRTRMAGRYQYYFVIPDVIRELFTEAGLTIPASSDTIKDEWDGRHGKPIAEFIDKNLEKIGLKFKTSTEIDPMDKLEFMSHVMKWVDSSISTTYLLPEGSDWKSVYKFILASHEKEVKSIAAFPDKKMYGIVSNIAFKDLAFKLKSEGIEIHHQNFIDDELKELNISRENVKQQSEIPERLPVLDGDIYSVTAKGEKFIIAVGLQNGKPYEAFAGHMNGFGLKSNFKKGKIIRIKSGQYSLEFDDILIEDFSKQFTPTEQMLFRFVSLCLRSGDPIQTIVDQLQKGAGDITSLGAAAARVLKKYITNGESIKGQSCPSCGNGLIYLEGCVSCPTCGYSKCS